MKKLISIAAAAGIALSLAAVTQPAQARDGGAVAAGVVGGLAAGAIIGSAASRPYYGGPAYYDGYYASAPGPYCHWERTQWIDSWGRPHFRRVRVCD